MLDVFRQTWGEVVEEQSKDPFFKKVYDDFSAFHENYEYWASLGFMPRPTPPKYLTLQNSVPCSFIATGH
jgi:TRAP-type mannitol/chloroaromatic compound transport system substrate-binding protein